MNTFSGTSLLVLKLFRTVKRSIYPKLSISHFYSIWWFSFWQILLHKAQLFILFLISEILWVIFQNCCNCSMKVLYWNSLQFPFSFILLKQMLKKIWTFFLKKKKVEKIVETNVETIVCHQGRILLFSLYVHLSHCWRNLVHILLKVSILFHKNNVQSTVYLSKHQNVFVEIAKCLWQNCKNICTNCKMYLSKLHFTLVAIRCILLKVSHCSKKTWF